MPEYVRLVVLADDPLSRAGLAALLGSMPGLLVIGQDVSTALSERVDDNEGIEADIVVWDLGWASPVIGPEDDSLMPQPLLALVHDSEQAAEAWAAGARGVVLRETEPEHLGIAIRAVVAGLIVVAPALVDGVLSDGRPEAGSDGVELTPRELEVLGLLAEGLTNKAIGQRLSISEHTVKFHVNAILTKLYAQSRTDAVVRATRLGLISL